MLQPRDKLHCYNFTPLFGDQSLVLTVPLLFLAKPESDGFVSEAAREMLCRPLESRPVTGHVGEDCWLLQVMQDLLDLIWAEGFTWVTVSHGAWAAVQAMKKQNEITDLVLGIKDLLILNNQI